MADEKYSPALLAKSLQEWRMWLEENYGVDKSIYLVVFHKNSKIESVHWHDAIEHALCYGWVDSIAHKRDAESCYLRFSPRNPKSKWGKRNIERAKKMISLGFMKEPGFKLIEIAKLNGKWIETP